MERGDLVYSGWPTTCGCQSVVSRFKGTRGAGIAQWLERRTRDRKVAASNPYMLPGGRKSFFSRVTFLRCLLFPYPFHPRVTAVKDPGHSAKSAGDRVTTKHACTLCMRLCMKWHGAYLYGVHRTQRDGSSFMWHQPCQRCNVHHFGGYSKTLCKKLVTHAESHANAMSLLESGE